MLSLKHIDSAKTRPNGFIWMLDHVDEATLANRTPKVVSKALNMREVWNSVCCHGNKTGAVQVKNK